MIENCIYMYNIYICNEINQSKCNVVLCNKIKNECIVFSFIEYILK